MTLQQLATEGVEDAAPVLTVRGLSKTFVSTRALDDVDFDLRAGEIHALVGQNGCGKSTLIKVLAGFHQPDPGVEITLGGERDRPVQHGRRSSRRASASCTRTSVWSGRSAPSRT